MRLKSSRIWIFGGTASGKTTLANKLSKKYQIPHKSTDEFVYKKNYNIKKSEKQRDLELKKFSNKRKWIIEGVHKADWILPAFLKSKLVIVISLPRVSLLKRVITREIKLRKMRDSNKASLKSFLLLLKYAYIYEKNNFIHHMFLIKTHKKKVMILRGKKEVESFLSELD